MDQADTALRILKNMLADDEGFLYLPEPNADGITRATFEGLLYLSSDEVAFIRALLDAQDAQEEP